MNPYKFPLQKLLDIRKDKEEQSKIRFKEAQHQKSLAEAKLNSLRETYRKHNVTDNSLSTVERKMKSNYMMALNNNIEKAVNELTERNRNVERERTALKDRQVERKTVEVIKDKRTEEYIKLMDQKEQIQNDEFALYGFIRQRDALKGGEKG